MEETKKTVVTNLTDEQEQVVDWLKDEDHDLFYQKVQEHCQEDRACAWANV